MSDRTHTSRPDSQAPSPPDFVPLVVDVDGTLTRSNLLIESVLRLLALDPLGVVHLPQWLSAGKAAFKARIADRIVLDMHALPMSEEVLEFIRTERKSGRRIFLASASDRRFVQSLADHLGLFDGVFGSDGTTNLKGAEKARVLCAQFGEKGFDYVGNSRVDLEVWAKARRAILVNVPAATRSQAAKICGKVVELTAPLSRTESWRAHLRAVRALQWLKNLLVFLPALVNHRLDWATLGASVLAFLAFCLCASSVYVLSDLMDLPGDRAHPTKRTRPFASGQLSLFNGVALVPLLLLAAGLLSLALPINFAVVLAVYFATSLLYRFVLKRRSVIGGIAVAGLYTVRIIAGAAATGIELSEWLLAFSVLLFLCLPLTGADVSIILEIWMKRT